jgi:metallo-beta-lactamase family protein
MGPENLQFLGGAGTVTGSRFLVESGGARVLVDCGLFQGTKDLRLRNWQDFPVPAHTIDAVVLTHAHLDHVGYLPVLTEAGFRGPVLCSERTADLATIVLEDAAHLQEEEARYANRAGYSKHRPALPLYTSADAARALRRLKPVPSEQDVPVVDGIRLRLGRAGHILGARTVHLRFEDGRSVLFTGDLGRPEHPVLRAPAPPPAADVIVTESTYGNRVHPPPEDALEDMADLIRRTAARGGTVVIPAFAVDRTEVVLAALAELARDGRIPRLPVYADSPMALDVLDVYRQAIADGDDELHPTRADPFTDGIDVHQVRDTDGSRALHDLAYPAILVSASGMATGGRVLHHLARRLPDGRNAVILTGYQAVGTRGQQLAAGAHTIKLLGRYVPVRAEVLQVDAFSVHADADELLGWLGQVPEPPEVAFVVHGEPGASATLADRLEAELGWTAVVPRSMERVRVG